jgi:hypothetical protein
MVYSDRWMDFPWCYTFIDFLLCTAYYITLGLYIRDVIWFYKQTMISIGLYGFGIKDCRFFACHMTSTPRRAQCIYGAMSISGPSKSVWACQKNSQTHGFPDAHAALQTDDIDDDRQTTAGNTVPYNCPIVGHSICMGASLIYVCSVFL